MVSENIFLKEIRRTFLSTRIFIPEFLKDRFSGEFQNFQEKILLLFKYETREPLGKQIHVLPPVYRTTPPGSILREGYQGGQKQRI